MAPNDKLKAWIAQEGIPNAEAARRVDYDRSNFHRILEGTAKPTMELAHRIESVSNGAVPMSAWIGFEPRSQEAA
jgi:plasmid maintenance system antidote protein VapI